MEAPQPAAFDLGGALRDAGIDAAISADAFRDVPSGTLQDLVKELQDHGVKKIVIDDNVRFGNGDGAALGKLLDAAHEGRLPASTRLLVKDGTIHFMDAKFMSRVANSPILGANGAPLVQEILDPTTVALGRNLGEVLAGEKGKAWFQDFVKTPQGKNFVRSWVKSGTLSAGGFLTSLLAAVGADALMNQLGITDFKYTFPTSMAAGYVADLAFQKAFVQGFQAFSWAHAGGLGANLAFSFFGSSLYNGLLDAAGADANSGWRGTVPELGVSLGFGLGGTALMAQSANFGTAYLAGDGVLTGSSMGAGGAALPFAIFAAANELLPRFLNSGMELGFKQQAQDDIRVGMLREGGFWNNYAAFMSCVPIFSNLITFTVPADMVAGKAWQWIEQNALPARGDLQSRLSSIWMQADGQAMGLDYRGDARDISFYQTFTPSSARIAQLMQTRVEFSDHYTKVVGRYGVHSQPAQVEIQYPPDDIRYRETHAYEYLTEATKGLTSDQYTARMPGILQKIKADYQIADMGDFLLRVQVKGVQDEVRFLVGSQVTEAEGLSGPGSTFFAERGMFNPDGTLKAGKANEMVSYFNLGRTDEVGRGILEQRKYIRTVALANGAQATPTDISLGLANADGSVNQNSTYFTRYLADIENRLTHLSAPPQTVAVAEPSASRAPSVPAPAANLTPVDIDPFAHGWHSII